MVPNKPPAAIIFFLVLAKKLYRTNYLLEDQNYVVQLIFNLKINNWIHLRNNIFSPDLTVTEKFASKLQLFWF